MALALLATAGVVLISGIETDRIRSEREAHDRKVLLRAKRALAARAALDDTIPGSLPCPDNDNDGDADLLPCSEVGRLPWLTLDIPELRDHAGEPLWYAMSSRYMDRPASMPLNSNVPGQLMLDGQTVVALVFAPGAPQETQDRRSANPSAVSQFLDGENATVDGTYTAKISATQNDIVVGVTAAEVMAGVHRRVLAIAEDLLQSHVRTSDLSSYIWLAPFDNPANSSFKAVAGVREGHLPLHVAGQNYVTDYTIAWSIAGPGVQLRSGANTLSLADLQTNSQVVRDGTCADAGGAHNEFNCFPASTLQASALPATVSTRSFDFNLPVFASDGPARINAPTAQRVGARDIYLMQTVFASSPDWVIRITDRDTRGNVVGGGTISFDSVTSGDLAIRGLHLAPLFDPATRPADIWYLRNSWHELVYVAVAPGFTPGGPGDCSGGCLTLLNASPEPDDKPALLLLAGAPLAGARPSSVLADYLDGDNASPGDDVFAVDFFGPSFNDTVRVLAAP